MRRLTLICLLAAACTSPGEEIPEWPPPGVIKGLVQRLRKEGVEVEAERLRDLREFPGCPEAYFRYRLRFSGDFVNVSRFPTKEDATACLADFRNTVSKAGPSAWDRMALDVSTHGPWLAFFPPERTGHPLRRKILAAIEETAARQGD